METLEKLQFYIFGLLLAVFIFLLFSGWMTVNADDTAFIQKFHTENIALTISEMLVGESESIVNYKLENKFEVKISENDDGGLVVVSFESFETKATYPKDEKYKIEFERKPELLILKKIEIG